LNGSCFIQQGAFHELHCLEIENNMNPQFIPAFHPWPRFFIPTLERAIQRGNEPVLAATSEFHDVLVVKYPTI